MLTLEFEEHRTNDAGREIFAEYDWWRELVRKAAEKADTFELRCRQDEEEGIRLGKMLEAEQTSENEEVVFVGKLTEQALETLTGDCVAGDGSLKFDTLHLRVANRSIFSSSHCGAEICWMGTGFAEMGFLMTLIREHPLIRGFQNR